MYNIHMIIAITISIAMTISIAIALAIAIPFPPYTPYCLFHLPTHFKIQYNSLFSH